MTGRDHVAPHNNVCCWFPRVLRWFSAVRVYAKGAWHGHNRRGFYSLSMYLKSTFFCLAQNQLS